ncbi:probable inactive leucine-rich repeat receptor-like protein kinase At3g03770 [Malania oleifera]|uniref:probable inactive leucine-rich repeat receptor-like protein kinase At3g03770 n=1 Tax=Malania oleifera TaxID=397392 RepID=UPI0025ADE325|nr:probable inactive leucine-rich repeat receptor-like protein kinase At3g03770 [Malania oleifera]
MGHVNLILLVFLSWVFFVSGAQQLSNSQTQVLLRLMKHLEYPPALQTWKAYNGDLCNTSSSPQMTIKCQNNFVTELRIKGDRLSNTSQFNGIAIPGHTLSQSFSIDSLFTTLSSLSSLRVLSLVSLGIWGRLPDKIHRLSSLELLDLSSNFMFGSIPPKICTMVKLQTLTLDANHFNDTAPVWLDSLSNLTSLSLKRNRFIGQFPSSICRITTLSNIALSHNELSGKLPDLSSLANLRVLDLRENHFDSELPAMPKGLVMALLSGNSISGKIPKHFGKLSRLRQLDLSFNFLSGTPPSVLFSLPNLTYLNLASNMLSGSIPMDLSCGEELGFVDISANKFVGGLPSCLGSSSDERVVNFGGNCLAIDAQHQHLESYCKEDSIKRKQCRGKEIVILVGATGGMIILITLLAVGVCILRRRCCSQGTLDKHKLPKLVQDNSPAVLSSEMLANARLISQAAKLGTEGAPLHRLFSLEELQEATNNFDVSNFMGEGSIGKLHKGRLENGTYVAVRSLILFNKYSIRNLKIYLDLLLKLRHPRLVALLGHCIDDGGQEDSCANKVFLVYEYVPNGNYRTHLSEDCPGKVLKWSDRLAILIGVAKAVHFLHTGVIPGFFNNQLKTNNILLDEHCFPKLSDYGMTIITEENNKLEGKEEGTRSRQAARSDDDVYNFGFILLESLVGPTVNGKEAFLLNEMASFGSQDGRRKIVDPIVLTTCSQESLSIVISITNKCMSPESSARPSFEDVLWNLQYAAQVQATADADQKSDVVSES